MRISLWRTSTYRFLSNLGPIGRSRFGPRVEELEGRLTPAAPALMSLSRMTPALPNTGAGSVAYAVTFDQAVAGVDAADFQVATRGNLKAAGPVVVTGSGASYTVAVQGIHGSGDLRLDLIDDDSIVAGGVPLGGAGAGNGSFQGQTYHVLQAMPAVVSIERLAPAAAVTNATAVTFKVTFSEAVSGVDIADFVLAGTAGGIIASVSPASGSVYSVAVNGIAGNGTVGLHLVDNSSIRDANFNGLVSAGFAAALQNQQTWDTGIVPYSVAVGDFNADGAEDLAIANGGGESVSVLLGNGDGLFQPQQSYAAGVNPYSIAFGDVNGDGKPDLAIVNYGSDSVSVLFGQGDGTFAPQQTYATGENPYAVTLGDINGDGKPDLAAANSSGDSVSVFLNRGDGTFDSQQLLATGGAPVASVLDDFNGDGKTDLAVVNAGVKSVSILLGIGNGAFEPQQTFATGSVPVSLASGDINGDGKPDLVIANFADDTIGVLLGNGDGTFQPSQPFATGSGPVAVALGDLNGDGKLDAAVANFNGRSLSARLGVGDGTFAPQQTFAAGNNPHAVAFGDLDGDGRTDLAAVNFTDGNAGTYLNLSRGDFVGQTYNIDLTAPAASIVAVDPDPRSNAVGKVTIHFSEAVQNVDAADFVLTRQGFPLTIPTAALSGSGSEYALDLGGITASGGNPVLGNYVLTLNVSNITDAAGNPLAGSASDSWRIVAGVATTTSLTAAPNATTGGQLVTFTATVAPSPGTLGTVTFKDGALALSSGVALVGGIATFQISTLSAGTHTITAEYGGAAGFFASASNAVNFNVAAPPPNVVSVTVNGNIVSLAGSQRSRVVSLVVVFDRAVQFDADAMSLALHTNNVVFNGDAQPDGKGSLPTALALNSADNITWVISFSGNTENGADGLNSLKDGVYDLKIDAAKVHSFGTPSVNMAINSTTTFHRLFGDTNAPGIPTGGEAGVDFQAILSSGDNLVFRGAFNNAVTYKPFLDFNGDGAIGSGDNLQFRNRFNKGLSWRV